MGGQGPLIAPIGAELHLLVNHAVGLVVLYKPRHMVIAVLDLMRGTVPGALRILQVPAADLGQHVFLVIENDLLSAGNAAIAEPVRHHHGAVFFHQGNKLRIIDFRAHHHHTDAVLGLLVRLSGFQLLQGLPEFVNDEILGADIGGQGQNVEFIPRNGGVIQLPVLPDLGDQAANLVMLRHRRPEGIVRYIHAVVVVKGL